MVRPNQASEFVLNIMLVKLHTEIVYCYDHYSETVKVSVEKLVHSILLGQCLSTM